MYLGAITGVIVCFLIAKSFIFPVDILGLKLAEITIGDILRIVGGVVVIIIGWFVGGFIGGIGHKDRP
jgi:hypothetical protein